MKFHAVIIFLTSNLVLAASKNRLFIKFCFEMPPSRSKHRLLFSLLEVGSKAGAIQAGKPTVRDVGRFKNYSNMVGNIPFQKINKLPPLTL